MSENNDKMARLQKEKQREADDAALTKEELDRSKAALRTTNRKLQDSEDGACGTS